MGEEVFINHSEEEEQASLRNDLPSPEEYQLLKAVNNALTHLLSSAATESVLEKAFKIICEAIECDGIYLFDYSELQAEQIISHVFFGIRQIEGTWERIPNDTITFPLETPYVQDRMYNMLNHDTTTVNLTNKTPEKLRRLLENMDIASYMSFRITVDDKLWGGISFVSRQSHLDWTVNRRQLLMPFAASLGNCIARKQAQQALKSQHDYLRKLLDLNPNLIFAKDAQGRYTLANTAIAKGLYGVEPEAMLGKTDIELSLSPEEARQIMLVDQEAFQTGQARFFPQETVTDIHGNPHFLQTTLVPLWNEQGKCEEIFGVSVDITDLKNTEQQLRAEKHFSESITQTIPDWVFLVDLEKQCFNYHNIKYPVLGYTQTEAVDPFKLLVSRLHPEDKPWMHNFLEQLTNATAETIVEKHFRLQHKDGCWLHFYERAKVMRRSADGRVKEYLAIVQDITEQLKAQQRIEKSERRYRDFINYSQEGIYYMNCGTPIPVALSLDEMTRLFYESAYIEECNAAVAKMYDMEIEQLRGSKVIQFHGGEHFEENKQSFKDLIVNNFKVSNIETIEPDINGNMRYFLNSAVGIIQQEQLIGFWGTQLDITEKKMAEQNLIKNKQLLKAIVNALPDLKFRINKEGIYLDYYESEYENEPTILPPADFIGRSMDETLPSYVAEIGKQSIHQAIATKQIQTFEYTLPIEENLLYYEGRVSPLGDEEVIVTVRNISDRKKAQLALQEKLRELDEKNKQLTRYIESNFQLENFAYIASHDLREPVRTMHSFAQLLKKRYGGALDEDGQKCLDFIIYGAENMNHLIEDLLAYSRVSSETHQVEQVQLSSLLEEIIQSISRFIEEKNAIIFLNELPFMVTVNPTTFKQLFQNLLINVNYG